LRLLLFFFPPMVLPAPRPNPLFPFLDQWGHRAPTFLGKCSLVRLSVSLMTQIGSICKVGFYKEDGRFPLFPGDSPSLR